MILNKVTLASICFMLVSISLNAQIPASKFVTCLNHIAENDSLFTCNSDYNLLITNDSLSTGFITIPQKVSNRFNLLKKNEIFFYGISDHLYIDSFFVASDYIYLCLKAVTHTASPPKNRIKWIRLTYYTLCNESEFDIRWDE